MVLNFIDVIDRCTEIHRQLQPINKEALYYPFIYVTAKGVLLDQCLYNIIRHLC